MPRREANTIALAPAVLRWARERASMDVTKLAKHLSVPAAKVTAWEETGSLPVSRLHKLALKTHTPVGMLFLQAPPVERLPIADFRQSSGGDASPSPELLDTVYMCQSRQAWFSDYLRSNGEPEIDFIGSVTLKTATKDVASSIRLHLDLEKRPASTVATWEDWLNELFRRVDGLGVLTMRNGVVGNNTHRHLRVEEFRGFALSDPLAPLVFINAADAKAAQMFTLIHELVHLWLGQSAVSSADPKTKLATEKFCNSVAAEVLVPAQQFENLWLGSAAIERQLTMLRKVFKVSGLVLLIRAKELSLLAEDAFETAWTDEMKRLRTLAKKKKSGGDFFDTQNVRVGKRFQRAVIESALLGATPYTEAFRLLSISKGATLDSLAHKLGVVVK